MLWLRLKRPPPPKTCPDCNSFRRLEAALESAESTLQAAQSQLKRLQGIARLVGPAQVADAQTAVDRAAADKHAAEARVAESSNALASSKQAELQAKVKAADADLKAAQVQWQLCDIRSPIAGRLGRISVFLGQSLPAGTPVATVTDLRQIELEASVPAKHIGRIEVGQPATISFPDAAPPESLAGRVTFVGQVIEPGTGCFVVKIVADNPGERMRSGSHLTAGIVVHHWKDVLAVPRAALIEETDKPYLFVAEQGRERLTARRVVVKQGVVSGDLVQVEGAGLAAGAMVVTKGNYFLPDGAKIITGKQQNQEKQEAEDADGKPAARS